MEPQELALITPGDTTASAALDELAQNASQLPTTTALLILPVSILLAIAINFILTHILARLAKKTTTQIDDVAVKSYRIPLYWTFIGIGLVISITSLDIFPDLLPYIIRIITSIIVFIWTHATAKFAKQIIMELGEKTRHQSKLNTSALSFAQTIAAIFIYIIGILIIISLWGINIGPLIASAGFLGAALAFGAKDYVANFVGGFTIITDQPYQIGDVIVINNYTGKVVEIGMRSTRIQTFDKTLITVPNNMMVTDAVINQTGSDPRARITLDIGVAYDSDLEKVEKLLLKILTDNEHILDDPEPFVRYKIFADSSINIRIYGHVEEGLYKGIAKHELIKEIKSAFDKEDIQIPFPQRVIHQS